MLEEVQRLQTLIEKLTSQLQMLTQHNQQLHTQLQEKPRTVEDPAVREALELTTAHNAELEQQLAQLQQQYQALEQNSMAIAERYGRLESNASELKNRFEALLASRDQLKSERDQLASDHQHLMHVQQATLKERDALVVKNAHAKQKVEAIIERLATIGQGQPTLSPMHEDLSESSAPDAVIDQEHHHDH